MHVRGDVTRANAVDAYPISRDFVSRVDRKAVFNNRAAVNGSEAAYAITAELLRLV